MQLFRRLRPLKIVIPVRFKGHGKDHWVNLFIISIKKLLSLLLHITFTNFGLIIIFSVEKRQ